MLNFIVYGEFGENRSNRSGFTTNWNIWSLILTFDPGIKMIQFYVFNQRVLHGTIFIKINQAVQRFIAKQFPFLYLES